MLTQLVTKTIEDQSHETTTSNKVQCASNQGKKDDINNDETDWSRQLHMQSFEDSLRQMVTDKFKNTQVHVAESNMFFHEHAYNFYEIKPKNQIGINDTLVQDLKKLFTKEYKIFDVSEVEMEEIIKATNDKGHECW